MNTLILFMASVLGLVIMWGLIKYDRSKKKLVHVNFLAKHVLKDNYKSVTLAEVLLRTVLSLVTIVVFALTALSILGTLSLI